MNINNTNNNKNEIVNINNLTKKNERLKQTLNEISTRNEELIKDNQEFKNNNVKLINLLNIKSNILDQKSKDIEYFCRFRLIYNVLLIYSNKSHKILNNNTFKELTNKFKITRYFNFWKLKYNNLTSNIKNNISLVAVLVLTLRIIKNYCIKSSFIFISKLKSNCVYYNFKEQNTKSMKIFKNVLLYIKLKQLLKMYLNKKIKPYLNIFKYKVFKLKTYVKTSILFEYKYNLLYLLSFKCEIKKHSYYRYFLSNLFNFILKKDIKVDLINNSKYFLLIKELVSNFTIISVSTKFKYTIASTFFTTINSKYRKENLLKINYFSLYYSSLKNFNKINLNVTKNNFSLISDYHNKNLNNKYKRETEILKQNIISKDNEINKLINENNAINLKYKSIFNNVKSFEETLAVKELKIIKLNDELNSLNTEYKNIHNDNTILHKEIINLKSKISDLKNLLIDSNKNTENFEKKYNLVKEELESKISKLNKNNNDINNKYDKTLKEINLNIKNLKEENIYLKSNIESILLENSNYQNILELNNKKLRQLELNENNLIEQHKESILDKNNHIEELIINQNKYIERMNSFSSKNNLLKQEISNYINEIVKFKELKLHCKNIENDLIIKENINTKQKIDLEKYVIDLNNKQEEIYNKELNIDKLSKELNEKNQIILKLNNELNELKNEILIKEEKYTKQNELFDVFKEEKENALRQKDEAIKEVKNVRQKYIDILGSVCDKD